MFQNTYFTFDGVSSEMMEVIACSIETGLTERQYGINRSVIAEKNINNPLPYDFGYEMERLQGKLTIMRYSCDGKNNHSLDAKKLSELSRWLYQKEYKPLISNDNPDIVYYVKFTDQHQLSLVRNQQGYIELSFECNAPWAWTKPYQKEFDLRIKSYYTSIECDKIPVSKTLIGSQFYLKNDKYTDIGSIEFGGIIWLFVDKNETEKHITLAPGRVYQLETLSSAPYDDNTSYGRIVVLNEADTFEFDLEEIANCEWYNGLEFEVEFDSEEREYYTASECSKIPESYALANSRFYLKNDTESDIGSIEFNGIRWLFVRKENDGVPVTIAPGMICRLEAQPQADLTKLGRLIILEEIGYYFRPNPVSIRNTRNTAEQDAFQINSVKLNNSVIKKYALTNNEIIHIHMGKQEVRSSNENISSRIQNCNRKWMRLEHGNNTIKVTGECLLRVRCQYPAVI